MRTRERSSCHGALFFALAAGWILAQISKSMSRGLPVRQRGRSESDIVDPTQRQIDVVVGPADRAVTTQRPDASPSNVSNEEKGPGSEVGTTGGSTLVSTTSDDGPGEGKVRTPVRKLAGLFKVNQADDRVQWKVLTLAALTCFAYFSLRLCYRGLRPDPQFMSFSAAVAQILGLATVLTLTTEWGKDVLGRLRLLRWQSSQQLSYDSVVAAVLAMGLFYIGAPQLSHLFNWRGAAALDSGRYSDAAWNLRLAVSLNPENARAHYNLANAYETLHDNERAISEYQNALELQDSLWPAYNNLGRLYLHIRQDPDAALATLLKGSEHADDPTHLPVLQKNIAEAYLVKGLPLTALSTLEQAVRGFDSLAAEGSNVTIRLAESYRLMALAYQELSQPVEASRAWGNSLGQALAVRDSAACTTPSEQVEQDCLNATIWADEAQEHLGYSDRGE